MATTFININTGQRLGAQLRSAIDQVRAARDLLARLRGVMDTQIDGSNYALLESQFGLQAGEGAAAYFQVAAWLDAISSNASQTAVADKTTQLLNQLG